MADVAPAAPVAPTVESQDATRPDALRATPIVVLPSRRPGPVIHDHEAERPHDRAMWRRAAKRTFDVVVAAIVLVLALPLMLAIALAVVLESRGPVFYRAQRVGQGGRALRILKFRKMPDGTSGVALTTSGDARLTRIGRLLERTKLDELPQLLNVLGGQMSIVGPRPEDGGFVAQRTADYEEILRVRPGLTGLSQLAFAEESRILSADDPVRHYLDAIFPQKCALDRMYVRAWGLRTDARIVLWTLIAVVGRRPVAVDRRTGDLRVRRRPLGADAPQSSTEPRPSS
jgi:lipopolysaccharide/colanic/teichoic acid biosynthesis glycosyltransferase